MRDPKPVDLVVELLRTLDEALVDFVAWSEGGGVQLMPSTYREGSYAELEARLREMRDGDQRAEWWHVSMRYRWGMVQRIVTRTRKTAKGRIPILPPRCELLVTGETISGGLQVVKCYTWSGAVDDQLVRTGVRRLVALMYDGDTQKLRLPKVFLERMLGLERGGAHVQRQPSDIPSHPLAEAPGGR